MPTIVYVDQAGEKVFIGNLFIKGENVMMKEAGSPKLRKVDMGLLEMEKSPSLGNKGLRLRLLSFRISNVLTAWIHGQSSWG